MKLHFNFDGEVFSEDHLNFDQLVDEALKLEGVTLIDNNKGNHISDGTEKSEHR